jgi:hypothetical protein
MRVLRMKKVFQKIYLANNVSIAKHSFESKRNFLEEIINRKYQENSRRDYQNLLLLIIWLNQVYQIVKGYMTIL